MRRDALALVGGAAGAIATEAAARRLSPSQQVPAAAAGLVTAAIIYPAARLGRSAQGAVVRREWLAVGATTALLAAASRDRTSRAARAAVAAGWVGHAAFDNLHDRGGTSRLPDWYPAVCAGYDVALAALLLRVIWAG